MEAASLAFLFVNAANFGAQHEVDAVELKGTIVYGSEVGLKLGQSSGVGEIGGGQ